MATPREILESMADALERMTPHGSVEISAAARGSEDAYGTVLDGQQARRVADALRNRDWYGRGSQAAPRGQGMFDA